MLGNQSFKEQPLRITFYGSLKNKGGDPFHINFYGCPDSLQLDILCDFLKSKNNFTPTSVGPVLNAKLQTIGKRLNIGHLIDEETENQFLDEFEKKLGVELSDRHREVNASGDGCNYARYMISLTETHKNIDQVIKVIYDLLVEYSKETH
jgi:hypothetical protein